MKRKAHLILASSHTGVRWNYWKTLSFERTQVMGRRMNGRRQGRDFVSWLEKWGIENTAWLLHYRSGHSKQEKKGVNEGRGRKGGMYYRNSWDENTKREMQRCGEEKEAPHSQLMHELINQEYSQSFISFSGKLWNSLPTCLPVCLPAGLPACFHISTFLRLDFMEEEGFNWFFCSLREFCDWKN